MAHELWNNDSMISVRERPWHGLGIVLPDYPSIEEAQRLANLTWSVRKAPIYYRMPKTDGMSRIQKVPNQFAIVRNDNNYALGVVGDQYVPFQNDQMFEFMGRFMDATGAKIETCGSLRNGQKVWALSQSGTVEYLKGDPVSQYLLFKNGFDGLQNVEIGFTDIRVVCNNTLTAALKNLKNSYRIRHTQSMYSQIAAISEALTAEKQYRAGLKEVMQRLIATKLSEKQLRESAISIVLESQVDIDTLKDGWEMEDIAGTYHTKVINRILALHEVGAGADIPGNQGTAYGLLNACVEWADHERIIRPRRDRLTAEARFESVFMGSAHLFKHRAFEYCKHLALAA